MKPINVTILSILGVIIFGVGGYFLIKGNSSNDLEGAIYNASLITVSEKKVWVWYDRYCVYADEGAKRSDLAKLDPASGKDACRNINQALCESKNPCPTAVPVSSTNTSSIQLAPTQTTTLQTTTTTQ